jgi:hypothetical protein
MVYYDLLMQSFAELSDSTVASKKDRIREAFKKLCASASFQKSLSGGLANKSSIERRRALWEKLLAKAIA